MKRGSTRHSHAVSISASTASFPTALTAPVPADTAGLTPVAVVEDNAGLRRSLERLLQRAPGLRCVGAWVDGETALARCTESPPDVVLMDINLPGMSGIECTARLKRLYPRVQVIMVTVYEDTDSIFRALKAGACGYLLKRATATEILDAIAEVRHGGAPMTSEIARRVVEAFQSPPPVEAAAAVLSSREEEILGLLSQGFSNKEIADKLSIAYQTVKVHLKHIYEKLHVRSRTEALLRYMEKRSAVASLGSKAAAS